MFVGGRERGKNKKSFFFSVTILKLKHDNLITLFNYSLSLIDHIQTNIWLLFLKERNKRWKKQRRGNKWLSFDQQRKMFFSKTHLRYVCVAGTYKNKNSLQITIINVKVEQIDSKDPNLYGKSNCRYSILSWWSTQIQQRYPCELLWGHHLILGFLVFSFLFLSVCVRFFGNNVLCPVLLAHPLSLLI